MFRARVKSAHDKGLCMGLIVGGNTHTDGGMSNAPARAYFHGMVLGYGKDILPVLSDYPGTVPVVDAIIEEDLASRTDEPCNYVPTTGTREGIMNGNAVHMNGQAGRRTGLSP